MDDGRWVDEEFMLKNDSNRVDMPYQFQKGMAYVGLDSNDFFGLNFRSFILVVKEVSQMNGICGDIYTTGKMKFGYGQRIFRDIKLRLSYNHGTEILTVIYNPLENNALKMSSTAECEERKIITFHAVNILSSRDLETFLNDKDAKKGQFKKPLTYAVYPSLKKLYKTYSEWNIIFIYGYSHLKAQSSNSHRRMTSGEYFTKYMNAKSSVRHIFKCFKNKTLYTNNFFVQNIYEDTDKKRRLQGYYIYSQMDVSEMTQTHLLSNFTNEKVLPCKRRNIDIYIQCLNGIEFITLSSGATISAANTYQHWRDGEMSVSDMLKKGFPTKLIPSIPCLQTEF